MRLKKGLFSLALLISVLLIWPSFSHADGSPSYSLSISDSLAQLEQEVTVTAFANHAVDLYGYEFVVEYDASQLQFKQLNGPVDGGFSMDPILKDNTVKLVHLKVGSTVPGDNGKVNLGKLTFKAKALGNAKVKLTQVIAVSSKSTGNTETKWTGSVEVSTVIQSSGTSGGGRSGGGPSAPAAVPQNSANAGHGEGVWVTGTATTSSTTVDGAPLTVVSIGTDPIDKALEQLKSKGGANTIYIGASSGEEAPDAIQVNLPGSSVGAAFQQSPEIIFSIQLRGTNYDLPVRAMDAQQWAQALGADVKDITIRIVVRKLNTAAADQVAERAQQAGLRSLTRAVDFSIVAASGANSVTIHEFGSNYVYRTLELPSPVDSSRATGATYNPATGQFAFVPTYFQTDNGKTTAWIKRTGNSVYTVVEPAAIKSFDDLEGHWAKADVQLLISKLLVNGRTDSAFVPQGEITRAEFATLLSKGLGLTGASGARQFSDVGSEAWYADAVGAAAGAGLVQGFADGTFAPDAKITREQMAVMISRALAFAGKPKASDAQQLASFKDLGDISAWARDGASQVVATGIMNGVSPSSFQPSAYASRAEAAVVLKRLLQHVQFIN